MNEDQIAQEIEKIITVGVKNGDQKDYEMTYNNEVYICRNLDQNGKLLENYSTD